VNAETPCEHSSYTQDASTRRQIRIRKTYERRWVPSSARGGCKEPKGAIFNLHAVKTNKAGDIFRGKNNGAARKEKRGDSPRVTAPAHRARRATGCRAEGHILGIKIALLRTSQKHHGGVEGRDKAHLGGAKGSFSEQEFIKGESDASYSVDHQSSSFVGHVERHNMEKTAYYKSDERGGNKIKNVSNCKALACWKLNSEREKETAQGLGRQSWVGG